MAKRKSWLERVARIEPGITVGQWLYDRVANNWQWILPLLGGSGMSYLASVSSWLNSYGSVAWGAVGIVSFLIIALVIWILASARERWAQAEYYQEIAKPSEDVNPLDSNFEHKRFSVQTFFSHFYILNKGKFFKECDIVGPGAIALIADCKLYEPELFHCDFVVRKPSQNKSFTAAGFERTTFERCRFFNVTLLIDQDLASKLNVIGDAANFIGAYPKDEPASTG